MADKDVNIRIGTEADTSGAEKAVEANKAVVRSAEEIAENERKHAEFLADHEKRQKQYAENAARLEEEKKKGIDTTKKQTQAVQELTAASHANPMTDGSQLRRTEEVTRATEEQADAVEDLTFAVRELSQEEQDALKAQQDADVERAKALKQAREEAEKANSGFDRLFNQQRLIGIGQQLQGLSQAAGEFYRQFRETEQGKEILAGLSEEATVLGTTLTSVTTSAAAGFAVGGPIGAGIGALTALVKGFGDEWLSTDKRIEDSNRELNQAIDDSKARIEARKRAATDRAVEQAFAAERAELVKQREELENLIALRRSQQGLDQAKDQLSDQRAAAGGASQSSIDLQNIASGFAGDVQGLKNAIDDSRAMINIMSKEVGIDVDRYEKAVEDHGRNSVEAEKALQTMNQSLAKIDSTKRTLDALEQRLPIEEERAATEATAALEKGFDRTVADISRGVTENANKAIEEIEAVRKEQGGEITRQARDILEQIQAIVRDNIPDAEQAAALQSLMSQFRNTIEGRDREMFTTFSALMDGFRESATALQQARSEINEIRSWMKTQQSPR